MTKEEALKILGITNPYFTREELRKAFRNAVYENHTDFPENQGKTSQMQDVNAARQILTTILDDNEKLDIDNYRNKIIAEVEENIFGRLIYVSKEGYHIPKKYQEFYSHNTFGANDLINHLYNDFTKKLRLDIRLASSKKEIDNLANNYYEHLRSEYDNFVNTVLSCTEKSLIKSSLPVNYDLIDKTREDLITIISLHDLLYQTIIKVNQIGEVAQKEKNEEEKKKQEMEEHNKKLSEFQEYKKSKLKQYMQLVNALNRDSEAYKKAAQLYQTMFKIQIREEFDKLYDDSIAFAKSCAREELSNRIDETRFNLNSKYVRYATACPIDQNAKLAIILSNAMNLLNTVTNLSEIECFDRLTFTDLAGDLEILKSFRGIPKEGIYISKKFYEYALTKVVYAIPREFDLYTKEIYLDGSVPNKMCKVDVASFKENHISLSTFFENAKIIGLAMPNGEALLSYDGLTLCRITETFGPEEGKTNYAFVKNDSIKTIDKKVKVDISSIYITIYHNVLNSKGLLADEIDNFESHNKKHF